MFKNPMPTRFRVAGALALLAAMGAAALLMRSAPVQAQGVMSAPACQCSAPTSIPGLSSRIAHCLCGAMSCAITEAGDGARNGNQMQCVRQ